MEYTPVGLWKGAMISLVSLAILLVILFWKVHKNNVSRRKINLDEERKKRFPKPDRQSPEEPAGIREVQKTQEAHKTQLSDKTPEAEKTPGTDKTHETT
jgi:FtsZ-interacting cell division protein ZipA